MLRIRVCALVSAVALFSSGSALAQSLDPGTFSLGGILAINRVDADNERENDVTVTYEVVPRGAFFIGNNLSVGLGVGFFGSTTENSDSTETTSSALRVNPFVRYHFHVGDDVFIFTELALRGDFGTYEREAAENGFANYEVRAPVGLVIFPAKRIGLELQFGLIGYKVTEDDDTGVRTGQFDLNLSSLDLLRNAAFGFAFYFNR